MAPKILRITGVKNSGKTRLIEALSGEFVGRGFRVAALKTTSHNHEFDRPDTDTWRFRQAGCESAVLISPDEFVCHAKSIARESRDRIYEILYGNMDLIFVEGAGEFSGPMIECIESGETVGFPKNPDLIAAVSDGKYVPDINCFGFDSISKLADYVIEKLNIKNAEI